METWKLIFWIALSLVAFNYAGYAVLAALFTRLLGRRKPPPSAPPPSVSLIVCAYNEADCLERKIRNSIDQQYPAHLLEIIIITDGSNDGSPEVVSRYAPRVRLLHQPARQGKSAALNRAVQHALGEVLIFSDANTDLNPEAVARIAAHYSYPDVGGVAGEKVVLTPSGAGGSEGLYWKYESSLKKIDSAFHSVVGAAGELFSLRRSLYEPVGKEVVLDDFLISLRVAARGFRVVYEPGAVASELPSFSIREEGKRKVRIAAGGFQAMAMLPSLWRIWRHPKLTYLYVAHRVMRWTTSPLALPVVLAANLAVAVTGGGPLYWVILAGQVLFYSMAGLGGTVLPGVKPFKLAYYFFFMNASVYLGFLRYLKGGQSAAWEKARRFSTAESAAGSP